MTLLEPVHAFTSLKKVATKREFRTLQYAPEKPSKFPKYNGPAIAQVENSEVNIAEDALGIAASCSP